MYVWPRHVSHLCNQFCGIAPHLVLTVQVSSQSLFRKLIFSKGGKKEAMFYLCQGHYVFANVGLSLSVSRIIQTLPCQFIPNLLEGSSMGKERNHYILRRISLFYRVPEPRAAGEWNSWRRLTVKAVRESQVIQNNSTKWSNFPMKRLPVVYCPVSQRHTSKGSTCAVYQHASWQYLDVVLPLTFSAKS